MTQTYGMILLLLAASSSNLQDRQPAGACRLETKYNSFTDMTTVQCDLVEPGAFPAGLTVQAKASFRGKAPNETVKFWLSLSSNRGGATRRTQPLFREASTLHLVMDSERLDIPVEDYHNDFYELVGSISESARAEIGRVDLRKLINAGS